LLVSRAQQLANLAYFDPSLLPLLYFPEEHKYAVYTPLFGPVSVPLVVGLIRELKEWKERRRKRKEEEKTKGEVEERDKVE
jgi:phosphatidylinositol glycan class S